MSFDDIEAALTATGKIFEMEDLARDGYSIRTWKNAPRTMPDILRLSAHHGDKDFIVYRDERVTFREHYAQVAALASQLREVYGIGRGDRVAIAMRNYPEWPVAFWAVVSTGAVVVPLNAWWTGEELAYGLNDSGTKLVIADQQRLQRLLEVRESLPQVEALVAVRCEELPEGVADLAALLQAGEGEEELPEVAIDPDDDATIFYTSGTTGFPKGTLGTHRNFCSVTMNGAYAALQSILRSGGSMDDLASLAGAEPAALLTLPLFHVSGCHGAMLSMLTAGGKLVMMHKWEVEAALDLLERERISNFIGVPTMVWQLLEAPDIERRDLSGMQNIGYGGAPAAPEILHQLGEKIPSANASNGWGITEASSSICMIGGRDYQEHPDSVGRAIPVCEIKVVDPEGNELPANELGELWVRGPNIVKGYWHNPQATAESFTDGWFHTGDVGRIDGEGFVYIVDRLKDMIIRGGENVYCAEVEAALMEHPAVRDCSVFGVPHKILGEEVAAVVEVADPAVPGEEKLLEFVSSHLAAYKVPTRVWLRTEPLPLGVTGKVSKKKLKAHYLAAAGE